MRKTTIMLSVCLIAVLLFSTSCATPPHIESDDPFSQQLDRMYQARLNSRHALTVSVCGLAAGILGATFFATMHGFGNIDDNVYKIGLYSSYGVAVVGTVAGVYSFISWNNSMNDYLETLRLQANYYNAIQK
jgi:hypothetical protein